MHSSPLAGYYKEYTCHEFKNYISNSSSPSKTLIVQFKGESLLSKVDLPTHLLDPFNDKEILFILKWTIKSSTNIVLDLFAIQDDSHQSIIFNKKPSAVNIAGECLYIVGGCNMHIINLSSLKEVTTCSLERNQIYGLEPAYVSLQSQQKGVILYGWNNQVGFNKKTFSSSGTEESGWFNIHRFLPLKREKPHSGCLKILIPNILGILINANRNKFCLVDLTEMKVHSAKQSAFTDWSLIKSSSVIVKILQTKSGQFDSRLRIAIGEKDQTTIQIFTINIRYDEEKRNQLIKMMQQRGDQEFPALTSFTNGHIIDWNTVRLQSQLVMETEGKIIDFLLLPNNKLLYYGDTPSRIPYANIVSFAEISPVNKILALEHNICKHFISDSKLQIEFTSQTLYNKNFNTAEDALINSVLLPNRYSVDFLLSVTGSSNFSQVTPLMLEPKKLLMNWSIMYKVKALVTFNNEILVIRENSLSSILGISKEQFYMELQSRQELLHHLHHDVKDKQSETISLISKSSSKYEDLNMGEVSQNEQLKMILQSEVREQVDYQIERPRAKDNILQRIANMGEREPEKDVSEEYRIINEIYCQFFLKFYYNCMGNAPTTNAANPQPENCQFMAQTLIKNRAKDTLYFYSKILMRCFSYASLQTIPYNQRILLTHYLRAFRRIQEESVRVISEHGLDLFEIFINKHCRCSGQRQSYEEEVWRIIKMLMEDLLPSTVGKINKFFKQVIQLSTNGFSSSFIVLEQFFNPLHWDILPRSRTVLSGVCALANYEDQKLQYINSYLLANFSEHENAITSAEQAILQFDQLRQEFTILSQYQNRFEKAINSIFGSEMSIKNLRQTRLNPFSFSRDNTMIETEEQKINRSNPPIQQDIWQLLRTTDSNQLEELFLSSSHQQIISLLNMVNEVTLTFNQTQGCGDITVEDILTAWVFLYRYFVRQLSQTFGGSQKDQTKENVVGYVERILECFENISQQYKNIYDPIDMPMDEDLINIVTARMINLQPVTLYQNILPTSEILLMIRKVLLKEQTVIETVSKLSSLIYYHLAQLIRQDSSKQIYIEQQLKILLKYVSRHEISQMIYSSNDLRKIYERDLLGTKASQLLGYSDINLLTNSSNNPSHLENLQFRNAFIEVALKR